MVKQKNGNNALFVFGFLFAFVVPIIAIAIGEFIIQALVYDGGGPIDFFGGTLINAAMLFIAYLIPTLIVFLVRKKRMIKRGIPFSNIWSPGIITNNIYVIISLLLVFEVSEAQKIEPDAGFIYFFALPVILTLLLIVSIAGAFYGSNNVLKFGATSAILLVTVIASATALAYFTRSDQLPRISEEEAIAYIKDGSICESRTNNGIENFEVLVDRHNNKQPEFYSVKTNNHERIHGELVQHAFACDKKALDDRGAVVKQISVNEFVALNLDCSAIGIVVQPSENSVSRRDDPILDRRNNLYIDSLANTGKLVFVDYPDQAQNKNYYPDSYYANTEIINMIRPKLPNCVYN